MKIEYKFDASYKIKIEFIHRTDMKMYHVGKSWPNTVQCLIFNNGLLLGIGSVTKHYKDEHNPKLAYMLAMKKAITCINMKNIRRQLWTMFFNKMEEFNW